MLRSLRIIQNTYLSRGNANDEFLTQISKCSPYDSQYY